MTALASDCIATIDCGALCKNAENIKRTLSEGTKLCAVVKANGYGQGAAGISRTLYPMVDMFAVATVSEGVSLRLSGCDKDILVLVPPFRDELERGIDYGLTFTVEDCELLSALAKEAKRADTVVNVQIKINSGMNRFGFDDLRELERALSIIGKNKLLSVGGVYSHFSNPSDRAFSDLQFERFLVACEMVKGRFKHVLRHISASGGVLTSRKYDLDMVRVGLLLYGYKPFEGECSIDVEPIMSFSARCVNYKTLKAGEHLFYGGDRLERGEQFGIMRMGYADGKYAVTGDVKNMCMDVCAMRGKYEKGNYVPVRFNVALVAEKVGASVYEVLTKSTLRCEIRYL